MIDALLELLEIDLARRIGQRARHAHAVDGDGDERRAADEREHQQREVEDDVVIRDYADPVGPSTGMTRSALRQISTHYGACRL